MIPEGILLFLTQFIYFSIMFLYINYNIYSWFVYRNWYCEGFKIIAIFFNMGVFYHRPGDSFTMGPLHLTTLKKPF